MAGFTNSIKFRKRQNEITLLPKLIRPPPDGTLRHPPVPISAEPLVHDPALRADVFSRERKDFLHFLLNPRRVSDKVAPCEAKLHRKPAGEAWGLMRN